MTYKEIAEKFGVTNQYVAQTCSKSKRGKFKAYTEKECVYYGLRDWLNRNCLKRSDIARILKGVPFPGGDWYTTINSRMRGESEFKQGEIERFLDASGLTYEQMFREKNGGKL
jgi:hypothetical protein